MEGATEKQIKFMDDLKINYPSDVTKQQAKELINEKMGGGETYAPKQPAPTPQPSSSVMDDRSRSIVAQCLTKCWTANRDKQQSCEDVLTAYNYFLGKL